MNRHARRAQARANRSRIVTSEAAMATRADAAHQELQRLNSMLQHATAGLQIAKAIADQPKGEDWTAEDGDPNAFKNAAIVDFEERLDDVRERLVLALEEAYLSLESFDPAAPARIEVVPAGALAK